MTNFIAVLNNPVTREMVDTIEDIQCSLENKVDENGNVLDLTLLACLKNVIAELEAECGFQYNSEYL